MPQDSERTETIPTRAPFRLGRARADASEREALRRVQGLTRRRFALDEDAVVMVAETACPRPDCPPLQTVAVFWTPDRSRRRFRLFKSAKDVELDDLPPSWLLEALASSDATEEGGCC